MSSTGVCGPNQGVPVKGVDGSIRVKPGLEVMWNFMSGGIYGITHIMAAWISAHSRAQKNVVARFFHNHDDASVGNFLAKLFPGGSVMCE